VARNPTLFDAFHRLGIAEKIDLAIRANTITDVFLKEKATRIMGKLVNVLNE